MILKGCYKKKKNIFCIVAYIKMYLNLCRFTRRLFFYIIFSANFYFCVNQSLKISNMCLENIIYFMTA